MCRLFNKSKNLPLKQVVTSSDAILLLNNDSHTDIENHIIRKISNNLNNSQSSTSTVIASSNLKINHQYRNNHYNNPILSTPLSELIKSQNNEWKYESLGTQLVIKLATPEDL